MQAPEKFLHPKMGVPSQLGLRHPNASAAIPPENAPQRAQKRETVSGHLGDAVSHVVDICLQLPSIPPISAAHVYLPRPPIRHPRQVNHTTRSPKGPYYQS